VEWAAVWPSFLVNVSLSFPLSLSVSIPLSWSLSFPLPISFLVPLPLPLLGCYALRSTAALVWRGGREIEVNTSFRRLLEAALARR